MLPDWIELCESFSANGVEFLLVGGQAVIAHGGEWVQYSTPLEGGAEYIAVCLPAFGLDTVHRDA